MFIGIGLLTLGMGLFCLLGADWIIKLDRRKDFWRMPLPPYVADDYKLFLRGLGVFGIILGLVMIYLEIISPL